MNVYAWMLAELEANRLCVCKVPGRRGGRVRQVVSVNAEWYRRFCGRYVRARRRYRRERTIIKRYLTIHTLKRLALDPNARGVYADRLRNEAAAITRE